MKFLLAFALVAVASAIPEPVRLLEPVLVQEEPAYAPLDMDEVARTVKVVNAIETADAVVEQVNDYAINFVDEAVNAEAPAAVEASEDVSVSAVKFVDEAVNAEAPAAMEASPDVSVSAVKFVEEAVNVEAPVAAEASEFTYLRNEVHDIEQAASEDVSAFAVNFVEEAVNAEAPVAAEASEDVSVFAVNFVEEAVNAEAPVAAEASQITYTNYAVHHIEEAANEETGAPFNVRIVQFPLPDSVVLPLDAMMPSIDAAMVADAPVQMNFDYEGNEVNVKVAEVNEEIPSYPKRYPDPRWR